MPAAAASLPGDRLHLHHGPIDLILSADAGSRRAAFAAAARRFDGLLDQLVDELPALRAVSGSAPLAGPVARRMLAATLPHRPAFITPMAAVAGAVADEVLAAIRAAVPGLRRAVVNNGGDVALWLAAGESATALMPGGRLTLPGQGGPLGIATSGWRGRSQSLGIADAVTVVAGCAAVADAAATMIANAVDLPGHPAISRRPARLVKADSDLGDRPVTVAVGALAEDEIALALSAGLDLAQTLIARGTILSAHLTLGRQTRIAGPCLTEREPAHA